MKIFNISKHIYYLFKPNNNNGLLNSYEDVFVPKILLNLYNIILLLLIKVLEIIKDISVLIKRIFKLLYLVFKN